MGPQPLGHGYGTTSLRGIVVDIDKFQWGHNLSVMDTRTNSYPFSGGGPVSMGPQPLGHGYLGADARCGLRGWRVSMGPQPLGHGYCNQMHDFVSRSLSFDENTTILHLPSRVALRFPSPFCTFDSRFCERSPFERHFGNVLSHT